MKIVTVLFSCVVFTIVSYIPCNAQPTFEENIIKEEIVTKAILEKTYPDLGFYIQTSTITMPPSTRIVAKKNDRLFLIPDEINLINKSILQDSDPPTKDLLESFVELFFYSVGREIKILSSEAIELTVEGDFYNYEMVTLVDNIEYRILFFYHENNIIRVSIFARYGKISEINPVLTILRDVSLEILGTDVKVETYGTKTHHYIAVSDNDTATNYTMTFNVTGLQPNQQNVRLVIEPIYWNGATYFLEQLLTVDISGNATYTWTPANDTNTGICNVGIAYETGGFFFNDFWVIPEHILTGTFTNGYDYTTYYTDQFFLYHPQGINHASVYAANAESALTNSWDKEINEWDLCQGTNGGIPIDNDDNYELCINDHGNPVSHIYHGTGDGAFAYGGIDRKIGIPCRYYEVHPNYTTENFMLLSVMSHEFYHGVQWSHNNGWGSNACNWMVEGQARFLQSVFMGEYSDPNEEFLPGRSYTLEATEYLKYSMSYGLSWVSYAYCMFWRFLFENYATGSTTDKLAIIRETCKGNTDPNTAAIKSFMDSKLNGNYSSFDEALKDFAKRCYLNDTTYHQWSPCPSDDYYITPTVTKDFDSDGITGTFKGFPLVVQDGIASCFTIDYLSFDFTEEFDYVYLKFDADPEDNGIMAEFYVNVLQFDGDSLLSENVLTLSGGEGSLAFSVTSPDFKIVPVIVRLDTNQSCFEHEYSLQLSKGVDVAIVIDRSGSMGPIYEYSILYAKIAAIQFVALGELGDNISVCSFSDVASVDFPLTTIQNYSSKISAAFAIFNIDAGGGTSIGAGIYTAQNQLNSNTVPDYPQAMIVLTDGWENTAPYVMDVLSVIPEETDIYTIGLNGEFNTADAGLLSFVAAITGGSYYYSPGFGKLNQIFNSIRQKVSEQQQMENITGTMNAEREPVSHTFLIDGAVETMDISLLWQDDQTDLDLVLVTPLGDTIGHEDAVGDSSVYFYQLTAIEYYRIINPDSGNWTVNLLPIDLNDSSENYVVSATGYSSLKFNVLINQYNNQNETMNIRAILTENEMTLPGMDVTCIIEQPSSDEDEMQRTINEYKLKGGVPEDVRINPSDGFDNRASTIMDTLYLYDDGNHGDETANDGIYGNLYLNTSLVGSYIYNAFASGSSPLAGDFNRQMMGSFYIQDPPEIQVDTLLYFSNATLNDTAFANVQINNQNMNSAFLHIYNIHSTNSAFYVENIDSLIITPAHNMIMPVYFLPTTDGVTEGEIVFQTNDPDEPEVQIHILGKTICDGVMVIDLDPAHNSGPEIQTYLNELGIDNEYSELFSTELDFTETIFLCLGVLPSYHELNWQEGGKLAEFLMLGGNLYMEGGNAWWWENWTEVQSMFNIDSPYNASILFNLLGQPSTFTDSMVFHYVGEDNYNDVLGNEEPAFAIFNNQNTPYTYAVAYDEGNYRTIGTSFEFGGLLDGNPPSTRKELLKRYLEFFGTDTDITIPSPSFGVTPDSLYIALQPDEVDSSAMINLTNLTTFHLLADASIDYPGDPPDPQPDHPGETNGKKKKVLPGNTEIFTSQRPQNSGQKSPGTRNDFYSVDDGSAENCIGLMGGGDVMWLNEFHVKEDAFIIDSISLAFGRIPTGKPVRLIVYEDPDDDGYPDDAVYLSDTTVSAINPETDIFLTVPVTPVEVGHTFFIAALCQYQTIGQFPGQLDEDSYLAASQAIVNLTPGGFDVYNLGNNDSIVLAGNFGFPGNWLLRAHGSDGSGWLDINPMYMTIEKNDTGYFQAIFDATGLVPGDYFADISAYLHSPLDTTILIPVHLRVTENSGQILNIPQGWSGISSYMVPVNDSVTQIFAPVEDDMVILMHGGDIYWPAMNINTIVHWNTHHGFIIKMNSSVSLTLNGYVDTDKTVHINPGWSTIPVLSMCTVSTSEMLDPLGDTLVIAKEIAGGGIYWPAFDIYTLDSLAPGMAYYINVNNPCSITYPDTIIPPGTNAPSIFTNATSPWNKIQMNPSTHVIAVDKQALDRFETGDVIGCFNKEEYCCGLATIDSKSMNLPLVVYGDDPMTLANDGLTENEHMSFKLFRPGINVVYDLKLKFDKLLPNTEAFASNGLSHIEKMEIIETSVTPLSLVDELLIYPNPAKDQFTVEFYNPNHRYYDLTLYSIFGKKVFKKQNISGEKVEIETGALLPGVYFVRLIGENSMTGKILIE